MKEKKLLSVLIATAMLLGGCLEPASYPDEPVISFKSLTPTGTTAVLKIDFTDGDGNIGLDQGDTTGVFCPDTCKFHYNLFLEYYELRDGEWTLIELDPEAGQIPFYYRVPNIQPSGQNPALNGEISIDMPSYFLFSDYDTLRFEIQLFDRDLNGSNIETTPIFIKP